MHTLKKRIQDRMEKFGTSVHALEKKAGLKPSAVNNILYGRSKNPSVTLIKKIAHALDCSVDDLVSEEETAFRSEDRVKNQQFFPEEKQSSPIPWNIELYANCLENMAKAIKSKRNNTLSKQMITDCIDEIYDYTFKKGRTKVDNCFVEWIIDYHQKSD